MRSWRRRRREGAMASCAEVGRVLQAFLDGQVDDFTAQRVRRHLEQCRRCGLEATTYEAIKDALARQGAQVDRDVLDRLRAFGDQLATHGPAEDTGSSA